MYPIRRLWCIIDICILKGCDIMDKCCRKWEKKGKYCKNCPLITDEDKKEAKAQKKTKKQIKKEIKKAIKKKASKMTKKEVKKEVKKILKKSMKNMIFTENTLIEDNNKEDIFDVSAVENCLPVENIKPESEKKEKPGKTKNKQKNSQEENEQ